MPQSGISNSKRARKLLEKRGSWQTFFVSRTSPHFAPFSFPFHPLHMFEDKLGQFFTYLRTNKQAALTLLFLTLLYTVEQVCFFLLSSSPHWRSFWCVFGAFLPICGYLCVVTCVVRPVLTVGSEDPVHPLCVWLCFVLDLILFFLSRRRLVRVQPDRRALLRRDVCPVGDRVCVCGRVGGLCCFFCLCMLCTCSVLDLFVCRSTECSSSLRPASCGACA